MVRPIVTTSPSQLLALKVLNSSHQQEERGENEDGKADIRQIFHDASLRRVRTTGQVNGPEQAEYRSLATPMRGMCDP
jgi:hypothetical protein